MYSALLSQFSFMLQINCWLLTYVYVTYTILLLYSPRDYSNRAVICSNGTVMLFVHLSNYLILSTCINKPKLQSQTLYKASQIGFLTHCLLQHYAYCCMHRLKSYTLDINNFPYINTLIRPPLRLKL